MKIAKLEKDITVAIELTGRELALIARALHECPAPDRASAADAEYKLMTEVDELLNANGIPAIDEE